jgi:hypothetical protein
MYAPRCHHCQTPIVDEQYITLDDDALGKRSYHEQHFFCAECGDPFLPPSRPGAGPRTLAGDGAFEDEDVGFTVYRGYAYCEHCHVSLRLPKCKRCRRPIRDGARAVEALGGKWCWECFVCAVSARVCGSGASLADSARRAVRSRSRIRRSSSAADSRSASHVSASSSATRSDRPAVCGDLDAGDIVCLRMPCTTPFRFASADPTPLV